MAANAPDIRARQARVDRRQARRGALIAAGLALYAFARSERAAKLTATEPVARPVWWRTLGRVWDEIGRNHVSMMAAGIAFYAMLSIFPTFSALISLYGLISDPLAVDRQLHALSGVLPGAAISLLSGQMQALVHAGAGKLGIGLVVSLAVALYSGVNGTSILMEALTVAFDETERRGLVRFYLTALALCFGLIVSGVLSIFLVAVIPAILAWLPLPEPWPATISLIRWPILAALAMFGLGFVYHFAPSRAERRWRWISPGAITAILVWIAGSAGFSFYVENVASYGKTYGSLGAPIVLLLWFYLTAYIILAGAELDEEIERRRAAPAG